MSEILIGKINTKENNEKIVEYWDYKLASDPLYSGSEYKIHDSYDIDLKDGCTVYFSLNKKILSDKTEIFAKVINSNEKGWNNIFKDFEKNNKNYSLEYFKEFLSKNYQVPKKIVSL